MELKAGNETTRGVPEPRFATINGFRMRYRVRGNGHPVIFVTGLLGSIEQEDAMGGGMEDLCRHYSVVHHDSRGRGMSDFGSLDHRHYTWEAQAGDLAALLDHLGFEKAHFIGGSQGSAAILAMAIRYPDRISAMVLKNPPEVRVLDPEYIRGTMEYADYIEQNGMDAVTDLIMSLPPNDSLKITHPDLIAGYEKIMRVQDPKVVAAATRGTVQYEPMSAEDLKKIECPALVLSQKGDGLHPTDIADFLQTNIPDVEVYIAPTMTHYHENPAEAPKRIKQFLTRIDGVKWTA